MERLLPIAAAQKVPNLIIRQSRVPDEGPRRTVEGLNRSETAEEAGVTVCVSC